jgi:prolyl-tRNA editing enzyme YbaK/EbsC (Cys-tRNA(Pro) deacylase)
VTRAAAQIGVKLVEPCAPEVVNRHSGHLVGGNSPFAARKNMPVYIERSILWLPQICINDGRRGKRTMTNAVDRPQPDLRFGRFNLR